MSASSVTDPTSIVHEASNWLHDVQRVISIVERSPDVPSEAKDLFYELLDGVRIREGAQAIRNYDPYQSSALLGGMLVLGQGVNELRRADVRLGLEQIRQALRDLVDEDHATSLSSPSEVVATLSALDLTNEQIAALAGVTARTVQRWGSEGVAAGASDRLVIVGRITNHLRHTLTPAGVFAWFTSIHPTLGERPIEELDDPLRYPRLLRLASAARSMLAT